ncbi:MAG TPA: quinolinate synthase NadA [Pseudogracilibacillus sp.]|nr:quinolinate synthase NadA [Pseudogracilibacillus sp.]
MVDILDLMKNDYTLPKKYSEMTVEQMEERIHEIKNKLGKRLFIPAHHYQKDEVVQFADATGDSLQLAQLSQQNKQAEFIVFCGVHFMAETADILTDKDQHVLLPDLRAGCSLADMANIYQTERAWDIMQEKFGDTIIPLTYVNSTAEIKAFVGKNGGATVTSSNAERMIQWALRQKERILFLPDQHLGRNVSYDLGIPLENMAVWDPILNEFDYDGDLEDAKIILWKGHCSVHENFTIDNVNQVRKNNPDMKIIVHPECPYETVKASDLSGSTSYIIRTIEHAQAGSKWAIGTEMNLVNRLKQTHKDKEIISLNPYLCSCMTMNRITLPYLLWSLESIETKEYIHTISIEPEIAEASRLALNRMLERA